MIKENLISIYKESFLENWELPAISDYTSGENLLYKDFAQEIAKIHLLYNYLGVKKGDKIALTGKNNIPWCVYYIATITYGAVIVPILQDFHPDNIHHIINHSEARYLFIDKAVWGKLDTNQTPNLLAVFSTESLDKDCLFEINRVKSLANINEQITTDFQSKYPNGYQSTDIIYADVPNSELVLINYTSGTTGFSKGVMLTANNLAGNITYAKYLKLLFRGENILSFLPLAHAYGCAFEFLYALSTGAHITLLGRTPAPKVLVDAFAKVKPRLIITVPLIIEKIYKNAILPKLSHKKVKLMLKIPGLRNVVYQKIRESLIQAMGGNFHEVIVGGAALNAEVEAFLHKIKFPFTVGYGMTECAPLISYDHNCDFIPTSCGKILDNIMEVRIDSEDPYNIPGEIQVRGENVMTGYYKNEKTTIETFTDDGWLKTGDLGTIDRNNRIYIRGRSKTMLLGANGQNIYPEEIEAKINNLPYISESIVIQRNSKLIALIYPDYENIDKNQIAHKELAHIFNGYKDKLNKQLSSYENIATIEISNEEFEKTPKKSIKRFLYK